MNKEDKYNKIIDSFQELLTEKSIDAISVSEIARKSEIAKGGIYYYFDSKDQILDALIERKFNAAIEKASKLAENEDIPSFTRMAMIFTTCRDVTHNFKIGENMSGAQNSLLHQKHMQHLIKALKPSLTKIINQAVSAGEIVFDNPDALADIVLIVLTVKMDNTISPDSPENINKTISGLVTLLSKATNTSDDLLNFLTSF